MTMRQGTYPARSRARLKVLTQFLAPRPTTSLQAGPGYRGGGLMSFQTSPFARYVASTIVVALLCNLVYPGRYVYATTTSLPSGTTSSQSGLKFDNSPAAGLERSLRSAKATMSKISQDLALNKNVDADLPGLVNVTDQIIAADKGVRARFDSTGQLILAKKLSAAIADRHRAQVARYDADSGAVLAELQKVKKAAVARTSALASKNAKAAADAQISLKQTAGKAKDALNSKVTDETHVKADPSRLPFRPADTTTRTPRLKKEQFSELQPAAARTAVAPLASPPLAEYLAQTVEIQFTPGIVDLAEQLNREPLKIFNYVRNEIHFVPTQGSIQGAEACRLSKECNAYDQASLLIALLRVSDIPARYVVGTVELSPELFRSAMGDFQDVTAAQRLAGSGGVPTVVVQNSGGNAVAVRMEHVWVEALVDYVPGRGASGGTGDTWVPLDSSIKRADFRAPADIAAATGVDFAALTEELTATATVNVDGSASLVSSALARERLQQFQAAIVGYIDDFMPEATVGDILGATEIRRQELKALPSSLPGRVLTTGARLASLPPSSRHQVTLRLTDSSGIEQLRVERSTVELAGHRVTIGYAAASPEDVATIQAFGGLLKVPPYLVRLVPNVLIDGISVATGPAVTMGTRQQLAVLFLEPDGSQDQVEHQISAGTYAALGLDLQRVSDAALNESRTRLEATRSRIGDATAALRFDDLMGETLHLHTLSYFMQVESERRTTANRLNVVTVKRPAEMLATYNQVFAFLYGSPVSVVNIGMNVDVRRYITGSASRSGDTKAPLTFMFAAGAKSSFAENTVFEQLDRARSVSAIRLLAEANDQGIPVYQIDQTNIAQVLPKLTLSPAVLSDIQNGIAAGKVVWTPQRNIRYQDWQGIGYLMLDPNTGAGGYLISGGLAGGGTSELSDVISDLGTVLDVAGYLLEAGIILSGVAATAALELLGVLIAAAGIVAAGYYVYAKTDNPIKGIAAGLFALVATWAAASLGAAAVGFFYPVAALVAVTIITVVAVMLVNYVLDLLTALIRNAVHHLYAWRKKSTHFGQQWVLA